MSSEFSSDDDIPLARLQEENNPLARIREDTGKAEITENKHKHILKAIKKSSRKIHQRTLREEEAHTANVDRLLKCNGLKRSNVNKDGNCFFSAVALQMRYSETLTHNDIRESACSHLLEYKSNYTSFFLGSNFRKEVKKLRKNGAWSAELADCLPLAIANLTQKKVLIFTSVRTVLDIIPNLQIKVEERFIVSQDFLYLAHIRTPGREHYDAVFLDKVPCEFRNFAVYKFGAIILNS